MNKGASELGQSISNHTSPPGRLGLIERFEQNLVWVAAVVGALFSAIFPLIVAIGKIDQCGYGPGDDISGAFIWIGLAMAIGAVAGALVGGFCRLLARLLKGYTDSHWLIGAILACFLAPAAGVAIGIVPALLLANPVC